MAGCNGYSQLSGTILNLQNRSLCFIGQEYLHRVYIGRGIFHSAAQILHASTTGTAHKVLVLHQPSLRDMAERLRTILLGCFEDVFLVEVPDRDFAKTLEVAQFVWGILAKSGFSRQDLLLSLGGGAVADLAGFVAHCFMRGIRVAHVPTTVLCAADAAIGGKCAINTQEGKNLVGALHTPICVIIDLDFFSTLSKRDIASGIAEIVKIGFVKSTKIIQIFKKALLDGTSAEICDPSSYVFFDLLSCAVEEKLKITRADRADLGVRNILNYGHTIGHAIEYVERYAMRHGEAVALGMRFAAELAGIVGLLSEQEIDLHTQIFEALGLSTKYNLKKWQAVRAALNVDKKKKGQNLQFVVLKAIGKPQIIHAPEDGVLFLAFSQICT